MSHEINRTDASDGQSQGGIKGCWTDIGEATVTHTIFGNAKVRIIRRHDKRRRALWLMATGAMVITALAWQAWLPSQQAELQRSEDPVSGLNATEVIPSQPTEIKPAAPPQPAVLPGAPPVSPKPAVAKPTPASKPHLAPVATTSPVEAPVTSRPQLVSPLVGEGAQNLPRAAAADQPVSPVQP